MLWSATTMCISLFWARFLVGTGHEESQNMMDPLTLTGGGREIALQLRDRALARYCNCKSCS